MTDKKKHSDHHAFADFGSKEPEIQQSQAFAMWQIAVELQRIADCMEEQQ